MSNKPTIDLSGAINYHYDAFPPKSLDLNKLIAPVTKATEALARYDQMLAGMINSEILLAPLRTRDAVVSSRMEGTISTLDEVLQLEAETDAGDSNAEKTVRSETFEVALYSRALKQAQKTLAEGQPISEHLIRSCH